MSLTEAVRGVFQDRVAPESDCTDIDTDKRLTALETLRIGPAA